MRGSPKYSHLWEANAGGEWSPGSWQSKPVSQQVTYQNPEHLKIILSKITKLPPLVTSWEIENLKQQLAEASKGERFLLQGGDCAESFEDCQPDAITNKLKILLQMSLVLRYGIKRPVIHVGRLAGQYAKPRSAQMETRNDVSFPSYRGDSINCFGFSKEDRIPNPDLLLRGYEKAALTLNFIRGLMDGGFADLHHPEYWNLGFIDHSPQAKEYQRLVESINESLQFVESLAEGNIKQLGRTPFYSSHEGLLLSYEQAQTRRVPRRPGWYNLLTHFPWIGDRTRDLDGAHVEYFRGIANPIGVKVGPSITPQELIDLLDILNPRNEPGKVTVIHRFGCMQIAKRLPSLIDAVQRTRKVVLWCCDPMHGNTHITSSGVKTRNFDSILMELEQAFDIHQKAGSYLGGVHFELSGENITECTGGARGLTESDLNHSYTTQCDPRLNYEQSLEMAMCIAQRMRK